MEDRDSSTGEGGVPADWVTYNPEEPLYEIRHLCAYLSDLPEFFSTDEDGDSEKKKL
jgi:hypothetical protein